MRVTRLSAVALAASFLWLGCFESQGERATMIVPPILQSPPHGLDAAQKPGLTVYLQAWPALPDRGIQLSVINDSEKDFEFDQRRLCDLSGLEAFAVDTDGNQHKLEVSQLFRTPPYGLAGFADNVIIPGFERIVDLCNKDGLRCRGDGKTEHKGPPVEPGVRLAVASYGSEGSKGV